MLRLAYLVTKHAIPKELVVNGDHTGVPPSRTPSPTHEMPRTRCHPQDATRDAPEMRPSSLCPEILTPTLTLRPFNQV